MLSVWNFSQSSFNMKISQVIITLVCITGFAYQTIILLLDYMSGTTTVNLFIGQLFNEGLPAVTICPERVSFAKLANFSIEISQLYQKFVQLNLDSHLEQEAKVPYFQMVTKMRQMLKNGSLSMGDILNLSEPFDQSKPFIKIYINEFSTLNNNPEKFLNLSHQTRIYLFDGNYWIKAKPIESVTMLFDLWKCYTFFRYFTHFYLWDSNLLDVQLYENNLAFLKNSHLDPIWKDITIDFRRLVLIVEFQGIIYPYRHHPVAIILHSPNDFPMFEYGTTIHIRAGAFQRLKYSTVKTLKLGRHYDTDCSDYGPGHKFDTYSDCTIRCMKRQHDKYCPKNMLPYVARMVREKYILENANKFITNCSKFDNIKQDANIHCQKQCKLNCQYKYYPAKYNRILDYDEDQALVILEHNHLPDVLVQYIPETSLISFVCNFGGLLGMWLGLSFLNILNYIRKSMHNSIYNRINVSNTSLFRIKKICLGGDINARNMCIRSSNR